MQSVMLVAHDEVRRDSRWVDSSVSIVAATCRFPTEGGVGTHRFDGSGPLFRNPTRTLAIIESCSHPSEVMLAADLGGRWYAFDSGRDCKAEPRLWKHEAFELLSQLYQMTVTDVARVPITIAK